MPLIASAAIGAGGTIFQGLLGSKSSKSAAKKQSQADQAAANGVLGATKDAQSDISGALGTLATLYNAQTGNLQPYLNAGTQGVNSLAEALAPGGSLAKTFSAPTASEAAATPGEQFMLQQGTQAIDRSAAARGGINTGATLLQQQAFGQGLASTAYQQAYNNALNTFQTNHNNTLGGLLALTGVGQNATGQFNQASQNFGGNSLTGATIAGQEGIQGATTAGNFYANSGQANAMGTLGAGQAGINTIGSLANIFSSNPGNIFGGGKSGYPTGTSNPTAPVYSQGIDQAFGIG